MKNGAVLFPLVTALLCTMGPPAFAQQAGRYHLPGDFEGAVDQEGARQAVKRGDIVSFADLLPKVRPHIKGEIAGQKLEQHRGVWLYEFRVIGPNGHMQYLHFDARTGRPYQVKPIS